MTLPYPLLLLDSARQALELSLKDQIVIVDEAHNLMDAISGIYSADISAQQLKDARAKVGLYLQKFRNKLKGSNRVYITQFVRLIDSLASFLDRKALDGGPRDTLVTVVELMAGKGVDQINLHKLSRYLQESKLARKVDGYASHVEGQRTSQRQLSTPVVMAVQSFFQALTNPADEGRFFCVKDDQGECSLRYMLLDPAHHFRSIVQDVRAVILAGGTMSPVSF